jgi:hypothetical protein
LGATHVNDHFIRESLLDVSKLNMQSLFRKKNIKRKDHSKSNDQQSRSHNNKSKQEAHTNKAKQNIMVLPLETVLMRHFGLWYCSARALTLEARDNLGMKRDELWTPPLLDECRRLFECSKGCFKLSPRALSLMSLASGLTATMTLGAANASNTMEMVADITEEQEAKLVKKEQEEWRKILKPSLGKIQKSKRNQLPPPTSKRTTSKTTKTAQVVSKDTKKNVVSSDDKNTKQVKNNSKNGKKVVQQVKGESSTEGESGSNNGTINGKEFPITLVQFPLAENSNNASSSYTKKSKKSSSKTTKTTMKVSTSTRSKPSEKVAATSSATKKVVKKAVTASSSSTKKQGTPTVKTTSIKKERSSATSTLIKKSAPDLSASARQRKACIKEQGKQLLFARMVSPIPATHWSSPMYP